MTNLPAIPRAGTAICLADMERIESDIAKRIAKVDDVETLFEWRDQAAALERYLRGKELNGPMLGAQRRVEARIGQLLGNAAACKGGSGKTLPHAEGLSYVDRNRFRYLAKGLEHGLTDEEWRSGREPLIRLIQSRWPSPRRTPDAVVMADGKIRKSRAERTKEITKLSGRGMRASQIAKEIGMEEETVRLIANQEEIVLPDHSIGKRARLDASRILSETINGVDAYVSGLSMLDGMDLPELDKKDSGELMQALSRSINGLRKLRIRMEKVYARHDATAA